jgi:phosphate:Na+ symporter
MPQGFFGKNRILKLIQFMRRWPMKEMIFGVAGGLALFIFGMNLMSDGLKKSAGERLRKILETLTKNPFIGMLVGTAVTAVIQSSSATTVMLVSFVNARLLTLPQAIGVIMGANIGTTMTAQLIAFKLGEYAYLIAAVGFGLFFFPKRKNLQYIGQIIFGFGMLFIGLNTMSALLKPLAYSRVFGELMVNFGKFPILGVGVGTLMTVVIQSSSATIGVLQTLASQSSMVHGIAQPLIPLKSAVSILFGDNIGTTITAILACIGANKAAKRTAAAHALFNILGCLIFLPLLPLFIKLVVAVSPHVDPVRHITAVEVISRQIANAHTTFNTLNTMIWLPLVGFLAFLVTKIIPGEDPFIEKGVKYLNPKIVNNPDAALELSSKELARMGTFAQEMLEQVKSAFQNNDLSQKQAILDREDNQDDLKDQVINYMSTVVSQSTLTEIESIRLAGLMHVAGDMERIADLCTNILELAAFKTENRIKFSPEAQSEVESSFNLCREMLIHAIVALSDNDFKVACKVQELEKRMDDLEESLRLSHINRLNQGICNVNAAVCYVDLLKNLERIADHCFNIAEAVLDGKNPIAKSLNPIGGDVFG